MEDMLSRAIDIIRGSNENNEVELHASPRTVEDLEAE